MGHVDEIAIPVRIAKVPGPDGLEQHAQILERDDLLATDVLAVAEGQALAVVVHDYYSKAACDALAADLMGAPELWTTYPVESGAGHIGTSGGALFNCVGDELSPDCEEYFEKAPSRNHALRAVLAPRIHPADRVRIEMDNEWPAGTTLLRINGRPAFYGLCRYVNSGGGDRAAYRPSGLRPAL